jgi:hypothetical protein
MGYKSLIILIACIIGIQYNVVGQGRPSTIRNSPQVAPNNINIADSIRNLKKGPDSIMLDYFSLSDINDRKPFSDTIIDIFFPMYDPSRKSWKEHFNLGNTGSASFPILYEKHIPVGTNYGFNSYRPYRMTEQSFKFFDVNVPLLNFYFTPVGGQQNFVIKTDFARSFKDGIKMSLNYDRINQEGFYQSQDLKHTNFGLSVWYHHPKSKQDLFLTFINSVQSENHNGGVKERDDLLGEFGRLRLSAPVNLTVAESRFQHRTCHIQHHYRLQDSLHNNTGIELISRLKLQSGYYKYSDANALKNASFYGDLLIEDRGLRNYLGYTQLQLKSELKGSLSNGISGQVGIDYRLHRLDFEANKETRNDLFLTGLAKIPIGDKLNLDGNAWIGLGSSSGDFLIDAATQISFSEQLSLKGKASFYRHQHPIQAQKLYINETLVWENNFSKPFGTKVRGEINLPLFKSKIGFQQVLERNTLYYNSLSPQIAEDLYSVSQADVYFKLSLWNIHLENFVAYQTFSDNLYHLPNLYYKFNTYWHIEPFGGKIKMNIGLDGKIIGPYDRINFSPLLSTFYSGTGRSLYEPFGDLYVAGQVNSFRFFVRYENIGDLAQERIYYHIGNYPQFDRKLRLGIAWHFVD